MTFSPKKSSLNRALNRNNGEFSRTVNVFQNRKKAASDLEQLENFSKLILVSYFTTRHVFIA